MPAKRTRSAASNAKPATPKPSATKAAPKTKAAAKAKSAAKPKPAATARPTRNAAPKVAAAAAAKPRATAAARTTARAAATAASASKAPAKAKASKTAPKPAPVKKAPAAKKPKTAAEAAPATPAPTAVSPVAAKPVVTTAVAAKAVEKAAVASLVSSAEIYQVAVSFDTTASMYPCLEVVKRSIIETVQRLKAAIPKIQIAIVAHGDYNSIYDVVYLDFTTDDKLVLDFIKKVERTNGHDFDECYEYAIYKARTELSWKADANKTLVVIGDSKPHEPSFSLNKLHLDWRVEAAKLKDANIKVYAVKCLNWGTGSFYRELARISNGHYLELHQLQAITNFMIAISLKEGTAVDQLLAYREEVRTKGQLTRNMRQLFTTLGAVVPGEVAAEEPDLDAVDPCRFQVLDVTENTSIKDFVQKMGAVFKAGKGFYEYTKAEEVQGYKEIVLMNKNTGDMYTGACARRLAGIEDHTPGKKAKPPSSEKWIMFVQSKSHNRGLERGTKFLYEAENAS